MWHISVSRAVNAMPALSQSHTMGPGEQRGGEWRRLHASECMPSHEPCPNDESVREGGTPGGREAPRGAAGGAECMEAPGVLGAGCA